MNPSALKMSRVIAPTLLGIAWMFAICLALLRGEPSDWFTYHMSYHEKWYPAVFRAEVVDNWLPPGFILAAHAIPWVPVVIKLRFVSLIACAGMLAIIARFVSWRKAVLVASGPLLIVFGTRAQPDALMLALAMTGILLARTKNASFLGGLLVGLSAFVKPTGLLALLAVRPNWKWMCGIAFGSAPFIVWLALNPDSIALHANKSQPFEDIANILMMGTLVGMPLMLLKTSKQYGWLLLAGMTVIFAIIKAPFAHEYYLLPAFVAWNMAQHTEGRRFDIVISINAILGIVLTYALTT